MLGSVAQPQPAAGRPNAAPKAVKDIFSGPEDTTLEGNVLANDVDRDGDSLSALLVTGPAYGSLTLQSNGAFSYVPAADFNGTDSFTYKANDGWADSKPAKVSLTVTPVDEQSVIVVRSVTDPGFARFNVDACSLEPAGTISFVEGPGTPPRGVGSLGFTIGEGGNELEAVTYLGLEGTPLSSLTSLRYATRVPTVGSEGLTPFLFLRLDWDDDGGQDDAIGFEPRFQTGTFEGDTVPVQGPVAAGEWQTWDALAGGWWSDVETGGYYGPPVRTLAGYLAAHPNATIVNVPAPPDGATDTGGIGLAAGCTGASSWPGFEGYADALVVGVDDTVTTFDFEPPE